VKVVRWIAGDNTHVKDLLRGASVAAILKAVGALLAFALSLVIGRRLGADAAGVYFIAFTVVTVAATIGRAGLDSAVLRYVAAHVSENEWIQALRIHRIALLIALCCSLVVSVLLYLLSPVLAVSAFGDDALITPLRICAVTVLPLSLSVLFSQSLLGVSRVRDSIIVLTILPTGIALVGIWAIGEKGDAAAAIASYFGATVVALLFGVYAWRHSIRNDYPIAVGLDEIGQTAKLLVRSGVPLLVGALLLLMIQMSGTLMLGIWSPNEEVSRYSIAWRTATLISFVLLAVNTIAQPKFAELYAKKEFEALANTAHKATLLMTVFAAPIAAAFLLAPSPVMRLFGPEFEAGSTSLQILAVGQFVNVAAGSVGVLLVMSGHDRDFRNVQIIVAIVVLLLNAWLIPEFGAVGAAAAGTSALIVQNLLFAYFVWTRLGILMIDFRTLFPRIAVEPRVPDE